MTKTPNTLREVKNHDLVDDISKPGFIALNEGTKENREADFVLLRQKLALGQSWVGSLHDEIQAGAKARG
jgi:hypothetical protein